MAPHIDAHHHCWKYNPEEYAWLTGKMAPLQRDFLPDDLKLELDAAGVDGVVTVEARQKVEETEWLLGFADEHDFMRGVVGWVPLASPSVDADLERFAPHPKLKSVRHVVQDEPDDDFILRDDFNAGVGRLRAFGLAYDIVIYERHLPQTIRFVDRHPEQVFVLDHVAKPRIKDNTMSPWRENLRELARRENVYCKLSGMVTEADFDTWTVEQLRPYMDVALDVFGPARLMFGTDWPVCRVACDYVRWHDIVSDFAAALSASERDRIMGGTAIEAYKL